MNMRQLRYLIKIIELKSFTKAAKALRIAQPALGLHVRNLEEELQTQLLVRHSRGVYPTLAGELLAKRANKIIFELDETKQELRNLSYSPFRKVTIGVPPSTNNEVAVSIFKRCSTEVPDVKIEIVEALSVDLIEMATTHQLDISLVYYLMDAPKDLLCEQLNCEDLVFVHSNNIPLPTGDTTFETILQFPLILPSAPHGLRLLIEREAQAIPCSLNVIYESQSPSVISDLVEQNLATTILSIGAVSTKLIMGKLQAHRIISPTLERPMFMLRSSKRSSSGATDIVYNIVRELVRHHSRQERDLLLSLNLPTA